MIKDKKKSNSKRILSNNAPLVGNGACGYGQFSGPPTFTCTPCDPAKGSNCGDCNSTDCLVCKTGYTFLGTLCRCDVLLIPDCAQCITYPTCTGCVSGYYLSGGNCFACPGLINCY